MGQVLPLNRIITRQEFQDMERRVELLEAALTSLMKTVQSDNSFEPDYSKGTAAQYAEKSGFYLGSTVEPLDLMSDPTKNVVGREFRMIECPKAAIPTKKRVQTEFGPLINFKIADMVLSYCRMYNLLLKDGPYLNFTAPKHDMRLRLQDLTQWILERTQRPGSESASYIDLMTDFVSPSGELLGNPILAGLNHLQLVSAMNDVISETAKDSAIGVSITLPRLTSKPVTADLRAFAEFVSQCLNNGIPLQYVGIKTRLDVTQAIDRDVLALNLDHLDQTGIPEVHITDILISNPKEAPFGDESAIFEEFVDALSQHDMISAFSLASPRTLAGHGELLFNKDMEPTASYEAIRRGFWRMAI